MFLMLFDMLFHLSFHFNFSSRLIHSDKLKLFFIIVLTIWVTIRIILLFFVSLALDVKKWIRVRVDFREGWYLSFKLCDCICFLLIIFIKCFIHCSCLLKQLLPFSLSLSERSILLLDLFFVCLLQLTCIFDVML